MAKENKSTGKVPNLRFPGFKGEWEERRFGEIATNKSLKFNPEKSKVPVKCIELEHISANNGEILGFIDGSQSGSIKNVFCKGDVLFGKLRPYLRKYLQAPFDGVCSSEIWVLQGQIVTNAFLYQIVQTDKFTDLANQSSGSKMPRADWQVVSDGKFYCPTSGEQQKISKFLITLEKRIQTQNKIIEGLKLSKQILVKEIFTRKIRFGENSRNCYPDWSFIKLGDVTSPVTKRNKKNEQLPVYSINNKQGFISQNEQFEGINSEERGYDISLYKIINKNTFAYNPARINVGSIGYSRDLENIIISSLYVCFITRGLLNDNFLFQYFKTDFFNREVLKNVEGGVRDYLFYENFSKIKLNLPSLNEQTKIADFLSSLDSKLDIEVHHLQILKKQKRFLLNQMFI